MPALGGPPSCRLAHGSERRCGHACETGAMMSSAPRAISDDVFERWVRHFADNRVAHAEIEARIDGSAPAHLSEHARQALVRSFQRFELGEGGDGVHLLRKAGSRGALQKEALRMLVAEEQKHSALFRRGLHRLKASPLSGHWSDRIFTRLRRSLGLRTELALFLTAEAVAMPYFVVLARSAPDEVIRGIGTRIALDEEHHLAFQIDQLKQQLAWRTLPVRALVFIAWWCVAVGAATVVAVDHGPALRVCGMPVRVYWGAALRSFRRAAGASLSRDLVAPAGRAPTAGVVEESEGPRHG